jgi:hypothetical protein
MECQRKIHRQFREVQDGPGRWDRAYQCLLRWGSEAPQARPLGPVACDQPLQEVQPECGRLCPGFHPTSSPSADH